MHDASLAPSGAVAISPDGAGSAASEQARRGSAAALAQALTDSRRDTLASFAAFEAALPELRVPQRDELNPPLWELGHVGWFQSWWLARFPAWREGQAADPELPRAAPMRAGADGLYDSGRVAHATRWQLPLPDADETRGDLARQFDQTLELLAGLPGEGRDDRDLYFFRLALLHEDMHHEAALYMAQALGVPIADARWQAAALPVPPPALHQPAGPWRLGSDGDGFSFDNELVAHAVYLGATTIDAQVLRWAEYLPFVESGGYSQAQWWTAVGQGWLASTGAKAPRYLQREGTGWHQRRHGAWQVLQHEEAACHLTAHEAQAWCRWAGRRLPTEAEWERAALTAGPAFRWGEVWEWTANAFAPYPGFVAHPYRDYSAPWFDGRPVLRGASFMTQPRMRHARYRNFFRPERNDVPAGLRSCAL